MIVAHALQALEVRAVPLPAMILSSTHLRHARQRPARHAGAARLLAEELGEVQDHVPAAGRAARR